MEITFPDHKISPAIESDILTLSLFWSLKEKELSERPFPDPMEYMSYMQIMVNFYQDLGMVTSPSSIKMIQIYKFVGSRLSRYCLSSCEYS